MRIVGAVIAALLTSSCASVGTVDSTYKVSQLAGKSLLVVSVTNHQAAYLNGVNQFPPTLKLKHMASGETYELKGLVGTSFDRHLMSAKNWVIGRVIAMELPPGDYQVYDWEAVRLLIHGHAKSVEKPDIRFSLSAGEVTYVGNIDMHWSPSADLTFTRIVDERDRDFAELRAKWPNIPVDSVVVAPARIVGRR